MLLTLHNDKPSSTAVQEDFHKQNLLEKLKSTDLRARKKGLDSLDASKNLLVRIGMEVDGEGRITKNSYGVFNLPWQSQEHPEWPMRIAEEVAEIKKAIRKQHGVPLRYVIWAGMGGSAEDKSMYNGVGLLRRGPRVYVLDSTDPAKLKAILADMETRSGVSLAQALKSTLVVGQALGMTSYEPVVNLQKLQALFNKHNIDSTHNFIYMTLPGSLLDQFGKRGGYRKVELQPDEGNSTSGRHSSPMTRGSLFPLSLASVPLDEWMEGTWLRDEEVQTAWKLSAFLNTQALTGRNKVTLLLPREWKSAGVWTKQDFEESLGKREDFGLKIVIGDNVKLANYRPPRDAAQDRCFLAINVKGLNGHGQKIASLKRAGYPVAVLTLRDPLLSRYMQFIHYTVFGIGYLQGMNFVTQPGVELYKAITNKLHGEAQKAGGIDKTKEWSSTQSSSKRAKYRGALTLYYDRLPAELDVPTGRSAPEIYASLLKSLAADHRIEYGELTFFGDIRYSARGKAVGKVLDRAGDRVFRAALKMPVDVYEGPAMNHSYHEMVIGRGRALSTVLISEKPDKLAAVDFTADYHQAQFLATQMALQQRNRYVVSIGLKDLEEGSLTALDEFFKETAVLLKSRSEAR